MSNVPVVNPHPTDLARETAPSVHCLVFNRWRGEEASHERRLIAAVALYGVITWFEVARRDADTDLFDEVENLLTAEGGIA